MVSVITFYCNDPSSNSTDGYCFYVNFLFEKNEIKQKEAVVWLVHISLIKVTNQDAVIPINSKKNILSAPGFEPRWLQYQWSLKTAQAKYLPITCI